MSFVKPPITSRGSVHIESADAHKAPLTAPNYLSTDHDREVAANALRLTQRIVRAPALAQYGPEDILPGIQFQRQEKLVEVAGNVRTTIFHSIGTCCMGTDKDPGAVVDSRLRVIGVRGLRVVNALVMPTITSGNTNSPTLMIAERASEMIREDRRRVDVQEVIATAAALTEKDFDRIFSVEAAPGRIPKASDYPWTGGNKRTECRVRFASSLEPSEASDCEEKKTSNFAR